MESSYFIILIIGISKNKIFDISPDTKGFFMFTSDENDFDSII